MSAAGERWLRARDFAVTCAGAVCFVLGAVLLAARLWFRAIFVAAADHEPLPFALVFLGLGAVLGILHAFLPSRLPPPEQGAYKETDTP